jgi:RNA ligase (TIGR02306 family)
MPNHVLFGEVFGQVQDLKYGAKQNQIFFRMFDIWSHEKKEWLSFHDIFNLSFLKNEDGTFLMPRLDNKYVPVLYVGPYSKEKVFELTDGKTLIEGGDHVREGVVIKPTSERQTKFGRVILKNVSNSYLERA